jgi:hypothetical protein
LEAIYKMNYRMKRIASCLLAGAIVISGTGVGTYGAQTGGVSAVIATDQQTIQHVDSRKRH